MLSYCYFQQIYAFCMRVVKQLPLIFYHGKHSFAFCQSMPSCNICCGMQVVSRSGLLESPDITYHITS